MKTTIILCTVAICLTAILCTYAYKQSKRFEIIKSSGLRIYKHDKVTGKVYLIINDDETEVLPSTKTQKQ